MTPPVWCISGSARRHGGALELVGERRQRQHDFVSRGVERPLAVLEVEEHAHAGLHQLLEGVRRFDRLASESALFAHHEYLKPGAWLQDAHQPDEPGAVRELRAGDAVVHVDVRVVNTPALARGNRGI